MNGPYYGKLKNNTTYRRSASCHQKNKKCLSRELEEKPPELAVKWVTDILLGDMSLADTGQRMSEDLEHQPQAQREWRKSHVDMTILRGPCVLVLVRLCVWQANWGGSEGIIDWAAGKSGEDERRLDGGTGP